MYSDYKGLEFINEYLISRENDIKKILHKLKKEKFAFKQVKAIENYMLDKIIVQNLETVMNLILPKIQYVKNKSIFELNSISNDIDLLLDQLIKKKKMDMQKLNKIIKKYEVKKILEVEDKSYNSAKDKGEIEEIYHLTFSIILIHAFFSNMNLFKFFNTLLKINDLQIYRFYKEKFFHIDILLYLLILEVKLFNTVKLKFLGN
jgi:hypothetical protein